MSYFVGVTSVHQLKMEYRRLAAKYHPDRGGDSRQMQEINAYYEHVRSKLERQERRQARRQVSSRASHRSAQQPKQRDIPEPTLDERHTADWVDATDFTYVKMGDTVYVNGTEGEVTEVSESCFRVVAKGRARQAIFNKLGGKGKYNNRLNASYDNRHRKRGFSAVV